MATGMGSGARADHSEAIHHARRDDHVDSLALAARDLTKRRGKPGLVFVDREPSSSSPRPEVHRLPPLTCAACGQVIEAGQPFTMSSERTRHAGSCPED